MSRSNGPGASQAGWPAQRPQPAEPELPGFDPHQQGRWTQPAPAHPQAQPPYGQAQPAAAPQPAYGGHYQQGYGGFGALSADPYQQAPQAAPGYAPAADPRDPFAPRTGGHGATHGYEQGYAAQPQYQPQPAAYEPPTATHHYDPYAQPGYGAPQAGGGLTHGGVPTHAYGAQSAPQHPPVFETQPAYGQPAHPAPDLRGSQFDQWPQAAPATHHVDAAGYDRSGYGAAPAEPAHWSHEPQPQPHQDIYGQPQYQPVQYQQPSYQQPQYQQPYQPPSVHPGYPADLGVEAGQGGELEPTAQHDDAADYEIDEPKSGRRWMMIAAALVGAIAVGGGVTYGYNKLFGKQKQVAEAPVVKNTSAPTKVKPAEPGGKQFAHTESKIMGRLNDGGAPAAAASSAAADTDPSGTRKVQTVIIGRDGSVQGGAASLESPAAPAPAGSTPPAALPKASPVSVPGMTIVDGFGGRPPAAAIAAAPPAPAAPAAAAPPAPARPVVVNPPLPPSAVTAAAPPVAAAPPRAPVAPKAVAALPTPRTDVPAAAAEASPPAAKKAVVAKKAAVAAPAASGGNGYVAVLASVPASQKSNMDALKQFADMQQKYGTALANKTPEVREANLGDKGTYHRLLVGPPGSREAAGQLCAELRAAGYSSCWVTAY